MAGYVTGTSVPHELQLIREAVVRITAAIQSDQDVGQAFADARELEKVGGEISREASLFRAWLAAYLTDSRRITQAELARLTGITPGRIGQLVKIGRERKDNPMTDPGTLPLQPPLILAVVTGNQGVLVCHRRDGRPPWTFPGGDIAPDESPAAAAMRKVQAETGLTVKPMAVLGSRVHPRTARWTIYMACQPEDEHAIPVLSDTADHDAVEWTGLDTVRSNMPDMFEPVKAHLEAVLGGIEKF